MRLAVVDLDKIGFDAQWLLDAQEAVLDGPTLRHLAYCADQREQLVLERLAEMGISVPPGERIPLGCKAAS